MGAIPPSAPLKMMPLLMSIVFDKNATFIKYELDYKTTKISKGGDYVLGHALHVK